MRPFLHTRIDFIGHLWMQEEGERKKMYILLFTCLNIRAISELVMSTSVIFALVRVFILYGVPSLIYSDNARAFVAGCNQESDEFVGKFTTFNIKTSYHSFVFGLVWDCLGETYKIR